MSFRWGILGTGAIARQFAEGLEAVDDAVATAVGSRSQASADAFGDTHRIPRRHATYADLAADPEVDAIYVSTPHSLHMENSLMCLEAGKPVLCEKPFAINRAQAEAMVRMARERGVFLMEAMWTLCSPVMRRALALVREGAIGEPRLLECDFGFRAPFDASGRLFDPALGGGALLDVGVYCVYMAHAFLGGVPAETTGLAHRGETGVDEQSAWIFRYPGGELAVLSSAVRTETRQRLAIHGTDGRIEVPEFWHPTTLIQNDREQSFALIGNGYNYEAQEVARCVQGGRLESELLPLDASLEVMGILDDLRAGWGLKYPVE
ncbi:MAG: Gfo/Idh/MocA family oxidoreductase [bacterium]|nr:Gfo/Idh/MocA family oxidoreductase [bacterium]